MGKMGLTLNEEKTRVVNVWQDRIRFLGFEMGMRYSGRTVIRQWNPTGQRQADTIRLWRKVKAAMYTDLSEKPVKGRMPRVVGKEISILD